MASPPSEPSILDHLRELAAIVTPLITLIVGLIVYAWTRMEGNLARLERALASHVDKDEAEHNELAKLLRKQDDELSDLDSKFSKLQGEHEIYHRK